MFAGRFAIFAFFITLVSAIPSTYYRRAAFTLQNGKDAIALNEKFKTLTASSPCKSGEEACIGGAFAQCSNGKFMIMPCGSGLVCRALPLVLSAGTSITCDTAADAQTRIANTGAKSRRAAFTLQNGKDAIALNQKFQSLTADTPCAAGENACIGDAFAQCSNGKFVTSPCAAGLVCRALPLVNSAGTSIACDTAADATTRIANTGAA
ncbi:hypothetical protein DL93DRAFT_1137190 [Clavulina sp. PMI_390]|nr:hypothetical protein DL93DRAFT_1137190 [Clavulina sp. PMI_390]